MTATDTNGKGLLERTEETAETAAEVVGSMYVVQVLEEVGEDGALLSDDRQRWRDIATVTIPKRAHRKTAVEQALKLRPELAPGVGAPYPVSVRALPADVAEPIPVTARPRDPEIVIG